MQLQKGRYLSGRGGVFRSGAVVFYEGGLLWGKSKGKTKEN